MSSFHNVEIEAHEIKGKTIRIYACWDNYRDYENGNPPEFYDVYVDDGKNQRCINEGDPYYEKPTLSELNDLVNTI